MRSSWLTYAGLLLILMLGVSIISAQETCDLDAQAVIETVSDVCAAIGSNEVCYGNDQVSVVTQIDNDMFQFSAPGDLADIENVRSLYLSALRPDTNLWGIAQMSLLARTDVGTQPVSMLLFGDVGIENQADDTSAQFDVAVSAPVNVTVRARPTENGAFLANASPGMTLTAIGRSANSDWVRVLLDDGTAGWIFASLVQPVVAENALSDLAEASANRPYFGPMQAFLFTQGSGSSCGNVTGDGLLIQTPQGNARVTLLINEVSIEMIPTFENGATALLGIDNDESNMSIQMLDGTAQVSTNQGTVFVNSTQQTQIRLNEAGVASSSPSTVTTFDVSTVANVPTVGIVRDPDAPIEIQTNNGNGVGYDGDNNPGQHGRPDTPPGLENNPGNANGVGNNNGNQNGNNGNQNGNNGNNNGNNGNQNGNNGNQNDNNGNQNGNQNGN